MDTDVDIKPIKGSPATIEMKMSNILSAVRSIDGKIQSLTEKRDTMLQQYEELKRAKEFKEKKLETQQSVEWDKGE